MGAVFAQRKIYDAFMQGPENAIELFHGYTYSGASGRLRRGARDARHLCRGGICSTRAAALAPYGEDALHCLRGLPHVIDIRNYRPGRRRSSWSRGAGKPGARAFEVFLKCFERGCWSASTGDIIALSPPLIIETQHIARIVETLGRGDPRDGLTGLRAGLSARRPASVVGFSGSKIAYHFLQGSVDFPGALESGRHHEGIAGTQFVLLSAHRLDRTRPSINTQNSCSV